MNYTNSNAYIKELYAFLEDNGLDKNTFLAINNIDKYIETSIDGYSGYPLFLKIFNGKYNKKILKKLMGVDYKSRLNNAVGISSSPNYESVMIVIPPNAKKIGMSDYFKIASPSDYTLLLKPCMYRQEKYEKYSEKKRMPYIDNNTWYIYVFATKKKFQRQGYGKKIMNLFLAYIDKNNYNLCLETDLEDNIVMYEKFGFRTVDVSVYRDTLKHYIMIR